MNNKPLTISAVLWFASVAVCAGPLVDPTQPYGAPATSREFAPQGPVLQSIMISAANRSATISGTRVRVGDTYNGAVVTAITPYEVRMNKGGREITLRLHPKLTKDRGLTQ